MNRSNPLLPEPRGFAGTAVMVAAVTALPFAILWSWLFAAMQQRTFAEILPFGLGAGFFGGVFFGLAMAFFIRAETVTVTIQDMAAFVSRLNVAASQLGFFPASQTADFFTYKPSFQAGLLAGRISVQIDDTEATTVGPRIYVARLQKKLSGS